MLPAFSMLSLFFKGGDGTKMCPLILLLLTLLKHEIMRLKSMIDS